EIRAQMAVTAPTMTVTFFIVSTNSSTAASLVYINVNVSGAHHLIGVVERSLRLELPGIGQHFRHRYTGNGKIQGPSANVPGIRHTAGQLIIVCLAADAAGRDHGTAEMLPDLIGDT